MNHYDDLQRFRDKTRNQNHEFKDLSAQNLAKDQGSWAIINQLSPATEDSALAVGGHVSQPIPQSIDPDLFAAVEHAPAPLANIAPSAPSNSIFKDIASQLDSAAPAFNAAAQAPQPASPAPVMQMPAPPQPGVPVSYAQLFAPKAAEAKPGVEKNQPLQSLLERIASCR